MPELSRPTTDDRSRDQSVSPTYLWNILFEDISREWISFKPSLGMHVYPCYACRHMFSSRRSLQDHVNRRIISLHYKCTRCPAERLTFYNRCAFLLHARSHFSPNQGQIDLRDVDVSPLPVDLAGFLPHEGVSTLYDDADESPAGGANVDAQFYSPDAGHKGSALVPLAPNEVLFRMSSATLGLRQVCGNVPKCEFVAAEEGQREPGGEVKSEPGDYAAQVTLPVISKVESLRDDPRCCPECGAHPDRPMAEHYVGANRPSDVTLACAECRFVAPTACSLRAHCRLHAAAAPHACPDCGAGFETAARLDHHLAEACFHRAKSVRFRCPGKRCGKLFATTGTFAAHLRIHSRCRYTCCLCGGVFAKTEEAALHAALHQEVCKFRREYECALCAEAGALTEAAHDAHLERHANDPERATYAYMCRGCRSYFRSTATFAVHLAKCNSDKGKATPKAAPAKYVTAECEGCRNKIIHPPGQPASSCCKCRGAAAATVDDEGRRAPTPTPTKRYYCILCSQQIRYQEKVSHMRACAYARPAVVLERMPSGGGGGGAALTSPSSRKRRRRRRTPVVAKRAAEPDPTAGAPVPFNGVYGCKVCGHATTDRLAFHAHVRSHRDISTAYQCMECGECFVVRPSLCKHLTHFHHVADCEAYLRDNDCFDAGAVRELEANVRMGACAAAASREPVGENQCRVCRAQFADGNALDVHFRMHGMAFLLKNAK